jgi:hypothetical protein
MLKIEVMKLAGKVSRPTRRGFLRVGALSLGGLTLGDVLRLRAEAPASGAPRQKSPGLAEQAFSHCWAEQEVCRHGAGGSRTCRADLEVCRHERWRSGGES